MEVLTKNIVISIVQMMGETSVNLILFFIVCLLVKLNILYCLSKQKL